MRILFVHEVNYTTKVVFEMHEFPELLVRRGHQVTFYHYPEGAHQHGGRISARTVTRSVRGRAYPDTSIRVVTPPTLGGRVIERFLAPLVSVPGLRRLISSGDFDVIVLYSVPTTGWQTVALARRAGVPVVFRAIDISHSLRPTRLGRIIRRAERLVYANADVISANNPALAVYCQENGGSVDRTVINLPPLDTEHFAPDKRHMALRSRYGIGKHDKVIVFMGTLFRFAGLEATLRALQPALIDRGGLRLLILGDGEHRERLHQVTSALGLRDRVVFTGRIEYDELPAHLGMGNVAINPFEHSLTTDCALPHKVLQYLAMGLPTVSTDLSGLVGVLGDESGVVFEPSPETVALSALDLVDSDRVADLQSQGRRFAVRHLSTSAALDAFEKTVQQAAADGPRHVGSPDRLA